MRSTRFLIVCLVAIAVFAKGQTVPSSLQEEIARIDRLAENPLTKIQILQVMALDFGTHRNHLILLKTQGPDSFGQIYMKELRKRGLMMARF